MTPVADIFASVRGPIIERPFPIAPLLTLSRASSLSELCLMVGARKTAVSTAAAEGLTDTQADRWAVALGFHPSEVWPSWWALVPEEETT